MKHEVARWEAPMKLLTRNMMIRWQYLNAHSSIWIFEERSNTVTDATAWQSKAIFVPLPTTSGEGILFSGCRSGCPSVRQSTSISRGAISSRYLFTKWKDSNETRHKYPLNEWALLKRVSRSKVKGQGQGHDQTNQPVMVEAYISTVWRRGFSLVFFSQRRCYGKHEEKH